MRAWSISHSVYQEEACTFCAGTLAAPSVRVGEVLYELVTLFQTVLSGREEKTQILWVAGGTRQSEIGSQRSRL